MTDGFRFPADVPGWLSEAEGRLLYEAARDRMVLEAGAYCGKSTVCLAQSAHVVWSVDPHDMRGVPGARRNTWEEYRAALSAYGAANVEPVRSTLEEFLAADPARRYGLAFIDTHHNYRECRRHAVLCCSVLVPGGLLAFHDYGREGDEEATICVDGILAGGGRMVRVLDSGKDHLALVDPGRWRKPS